LPDIQSIMLKIFNGNWKFLNRYKKVFPKLLFVLYASTENAYTFTDKQLP